MLLLDVDADVRGAEMVKLKILGEKDTVVAHKHVCVSAFRFNIVMKVGGLYAIRKE